MISTKYIFLVLALLGLVAATEPQQRKSWIIIHQLDILQTETRQLSAALDFWDKSLMGAIDVSSQTEKLLQVTKNATVNITTNSKGLGLLGSLHVKSNTESLVKDIKNSVGHIGTLKEDFVKVGLAQTVLNSLISQQTASLEMNDAVILKIFWLGRPMARAMARRIFKIFQGTIDEYKQMLNGTSEISPQKVEVVSDSEEPTALDTPQP